MNIKRLIYSFLVLLFLSGITSADIWKTLGKRGFTEEEASSLPVAVNGGGDLDVLANDNSTDKVSWYENNYLQPAPVITAIPDTTINFGPQFKYTAISTGEPAPVFSLTEAPSGMTIDESTGVIEWTPSFAQIGDQQVTVQVVNSSGSDTESFQITVNLPVWSQIGNSLSTPDFRFAVSGDGVPYLAYNENDILSVKKFDGDNWVAVGNTGYTPSPMSFSIAIDNSGTPYLAYVDMWQENKATVIKFNGSSWAVVGKVGFSISEFQTLRIYADADGVINVAGVTPFGPPEAYWFDEANNIWRDFGFNELQNYSAEGYFSFAPGSNGIPYFAFRGMKVPDFFTQKGFVLKYDKVNNSWIELGTLSNNGYVYGTKSLATDNSGTPYVVLATGGPATEYSVMKYENSSWASVGETFGYPGSSLALAIDKAGTPFVCFDDTSHARKLTVVQYNGTNWESVGDPGFTDEPVKGLSLGISNGGSLFVASANDGYSKTTVLKHFRSINPPIVKTNTGLTLDQGTTALIDTTNINVTDADTDEQSIIFKITAPPVNGEIQLSGNAVSTFTQADVIAGSVAYAHNGSETTEDSLTFSVSDVDHVISGQRFNITIIDVDIPPVVAVNEALTLDEGAAAVLDSTHLRGTDADTEDSTLVYFIGVNDLPSFGKLQKNSADFPAGQDVSFTQGDINAGRISYVHDGGETPGDSLLFSLKDANNTLSAEFFKFIINNTDDMPVVVNNKGLTVQQGSTAIIDSSLLLVTDEEELPPRCYIETLPSHGTLELDGVQLEVNSAFYQSDINNLKLSYIHDGSKTFEDSFTFNVWDGTQYLLDQTVNITVFSSAWNSMGPNNQIYQEGFLPPFAVDGNGISYVMTDPPFQNLVLKNTAPYQWEAVGKQGFSANINASRADMDIDNSKTPYIVINDADNEYKASVMKFNGTNWEFVGTRGFSPNVIDGVSIKLDADGTPFISYVFQSKITVMKFNGTDWELVGGDGFSTVAGNDSRLSLTLNSSGVPFVAFGDKGNSNKATVMKFNGVNWVQVGNAGFSLGEANYIDIAINSSGTPFVAYSDLANSQKATVMKYDGGNWVNVGDAQGFSDGGTQYLSLKIDIEDIPFVAYSDMANQGKITVTGFYNNKWVPMGSPGFTSSESVGVTLDIDNNSSLYVCYEEMQFNPFPSAFVNVKKLERKFTLPLKIAENAGLTLNEDSRSVIDSTLLKSSSDNQSDPGYIEYTIKSGPPFGDILLSDSITSTFTQEDINAGNVMYVHRGREVTHDEFTFSVSDGVNDLTDQKFEITIIPVNDAPIILSPGLPDVSFPEDSSYTLALDSLAWDPESDFTDLFWSVSSLAGLKVGGISSAGNVSSYLFLFNGNSTTTAANSQPSKNSKSLKSFDESEFKAGKKSKSTGKFADGGSMVQISKTDSILITIDNPNHLATFSATTNYNIKDVPFLFTVMDSDSATTSDTLTVTVTPVNDNMALVNNAGLTLDEGATAVIDSSKLLVIDIDTDDSSLLFSITTQPANGEILLSDSAAVSFTQADINAGNVTYVHDGSETTSDTMIVSMNDGEYEITNQTFIITVTPVNDAPGFTTRPSISGTAIVGEVLSVTIGNWDDAEGDSLSFTYQWYSDSDSLNYDGSVIVNAADSVYTLSTNDLGNYIYAVVTADDGNGNSVSANSNYTATAIITGVEDAEIPTEFSLSQNYPNPFNPSTILKYGLKEETDVRLEVFNLLGERVTTLVNERQNAGYYNLRLNMSAYSTGVYIYRLQAGSFVSVKKMIMMK